MIALELVKMAALAAVVGCLAAQWLSGLTAATLAVVVLYGLLVRAS